MQGLKRRAEPRWDAPGLGGSTVWRRRLTIISPRKTCAVLALALVVSLGSCGDEEHTGGLQREVTFRFSMRGDTLGTEDFVAVTADETVIARARAELLLPMDQRIYHIHGVIGLGNGGHNLDWSWHFFPEQWALVEESIEVCDDKPSAVEASIGSWRDTVRIFCPLVSYVSAEVR
jgi:hypothetical protein